MSDRRQGHRWEPIAELPPAWREQRFPELDELVSVFGARRRELESAHAVREFQARLVRSWSIETGILERLYSLSASATLTLLERGFDAALLSHGDSDLPSAQLVAVLRDHQDAAEGLFQFVRGGRSLSTSYVRELHQVMTRHQHTCDALDAQGNWVAVPLRRGDWKVLPNNPGDAATGEVWHQYCPPEQTASEMDRLIAMHEQHGGVHFVVEAAWLHHRFTQIHPFQDGNGRVARALASLVCIRGHGFPVVVMRDQKADYIRALERADLGDLGPLVRMFERQQQVAFTQALSLSHAAVEEAQDIDAILADAKRRLEAAQQAPISALSARLRVVVADAVHVLEEAVGKLVAQLSPHVVARVEVGAEGDVQSFAAETSEAAAWHGIAPNLAAPRRWIALAIEYRGTSRLVVSFHHVGPVDYGVIVGTVFLLPSDGVRTSAARATTLFPLESACPRPFTFTAMRDEAELRATLGAWLRDSLALGLGLWRRGL
jgi:hypothetical protein